MPDGAVIDLIAIAAGLRASGAGPASAGRGLDWRLFAHGRLDAWMPAPAGYGPWLVAVWIADDAADPNPDSGLDGNDSIVAHAAAFGPRGARRAVQATLVRVASTPPASAADRHARATRGVERRPVRKAARDRAR